MAPAKVRTALVIISNTPFIHISSCPTSRTLVIASPSSTQRSSSRIEVVRKLKTNDFRHISLFMVLENAGCTNRFNINLERPFETPWLVGWMWRGLKFREGGGGGVKSRSFLFPSPFIKKYSCFIQFLLLKPSRFHWLFAQLAVLK